MQLIRLLIFIFGTLSMPVLSALAADTKPSSNMATSISSHDTQALIHSHLARVRNFEERRKALLAAEEARKKGADQMTLLRFKVDQAKEKIRAEFARTRKKEDPLAAEKRDQLYEAEIQRREKDRDKVRQAYVARRDRLLRILASLPQIDPMREYDLTTDWERPDHSDSN